MTSTPIAEVRVDIPAGRIEVVGMPGREDVAVVVNPANRSRSGDREAAENARIERVGDALVVTVPSRTSIFGRPDAVDVVVEGPETLRVDAATKYGDIYVLGTVASARTSTSHGAVNINAVGDLEVDGGNGAVRIGDVAGDGSVALTNGSVHVESVRGTLDVRGSNGSIRVDRATGPARLATTNGAIKVGAVAGGVEARTTNGSIRVRDLSGGVSRCVSSMGSVTVGVRSGVPLWLDAASDHGAVRTDLDVDGGPLDGEAPVELHVHTGYGAVKVQRA
ncbi:DUF4097 family beta strand repeat-containing protein [Demequina sediminicola]|uniref:DUF4097 family beta strand repeat-containing protein n=1 Tax=Demequina sediminicola TaxID=1095026 RepID=UPI0007805ED9|nr:DUF4097 family beta strand repeat-containing protein [Demequina sediminicola]